MAEVRSAIDEADCFCFVVSPDSVESPVCREEAAHAAASNKRILPLLHREVADGLVPETVAAHNWIAFDGEASFDQAFATLVKALETEPEHLRAHTRLLVRSKEWEGSDRDRSHLLRGSDLNQAEAWLATSQGKEPAPTQGQTAYVLASRKATSRRQRTVVGAVAVALVLSLVLSAVAIAQRGEAQDAQARAEERASESRSRELAASAVSQLYVEPQRALLLAREAIEVRRTPEAQDALREALLASNVRAIIDAGSTVREAEFDPTGETILTAQDGEVVLWDAETRQALLRLPVSGQLHAASFDPTASKIATGGDDGVVRVWDLAAGEELFALEGHQDFVNTVRWTPDGEQIVSASPDSVRIWNAESGNLQRVVTPRLFFWSADPSPDGAMVVAADRSGVAVVLDAATGEEVRTIETGPAPLTHALYSPDGSMIATAGDDGVVRLYSATGGDLRMVLPHANGIERLSFSKDGTYVLTADSGGAGHVWDPIFGFELGTFLTDGSGVMTAISLSPDGRTVLTAGPYGSVRLWSPSPTLPVIRFETGVPNHGGSFDPSGDRAAFFGAFGAPTSIWDVATGEVIVSLELDQPATSTAFSPDGAVITVGVENGVLAFDAHSGRQLFFFEGQVRSPSAQDSGYTPDVAVSPDGEFVAAVAQLDPSVHLWEAATGEPIRSWEAGQDQLTSVAVSTRGVVATAGSAGVRVWSTEGAMEWEATTEAPVFGVAFDGEGSLLAAAVGNGTARVWDAETGADVSVLTGHENEVVSVSLNPDGRFLISSAFDGTARTGTSRAASNCR